jgi:hypothetical protein
MPVPHTITDAERPILRVVPIGVNWTPLSVRPVCGSIYPLQSSFQHLLVHVRRVLGVTSATFTSALTRKSIVSLNAPMIFAAFSQCLVPGRAA